MEDDIGLALTAPPEIGDAVLRDDAGRVIVAGRIRLVDEEGLRVRSLPVGLDPSREGERRQHQAEKAPMSRQNRASLSRSPAMRAVRFNAGRSTCPETGDLNKAALQPTA